MSKCGLPFFPAVKCFRSHGQASAGFGLLELMIVAGLIGIIAYHTSEMFTSSFRGNKKLELDSERIEIARTISARLDCSNTYEAYNGIGIDLLTATTPCNNANTLKVYDKNGAVMIEDNAGTPTKFGNWTVRALCVNAVSSPTNPILRGFRIEAARVKSGVTNALVSGTTSDLYPS